MAYCGKCGSELRDGLNFCPNCGAKIKEKTASRRGLDFLEEVNKALGSIDADAIASGATAAAGALGKTLGKAAEGATQVASQAKVAFEDGMKSVQEGVDKASQALDDVDPVDLARETAAKVTEFASTIDEGRQADGAAPGEIAEREGIVEHKGVAEREEPTERKVAAEREETVVPEESVIPEKPVRVVEPLAGLEPAEPIEATDQISSIENAGAVRGAESVRPEVGSDVASLEEAARQPDKGALETQVDSTSRVISPRPRGGESEAMPPSKGKSPAVILALLVGALVILLTMALVTCGSSSGSGSKPSGSSDSSAVMTLTPDPEYVVHLSASCKENLMFSRYDVTVIVDGSEEFTLAHGASEEKDLQLEAGSHTLEFHKTDEPKVCGENSFEVAGETYVTCTIETTSDKVNIAEFVVQTAAEKKAADEKAATEAASTESAESPETSPEATGNAGQQESGEAQESAAESETAEVLTVDNCPEMAELFSAGDPSPSDFAAKYAGRTIEFDGNIANLAHHDSAKTRYDVLIHAGDYSTEHVRGPEMRYTDISLSYDLGADDNLDVINTGMNVHITAKVGKYNKYQGILELTPISMSMR